jgi:hypothetical protein
LKNNYLQTFKAATITFFTPIYEVFKTISAKYLSTLLFLLLPITFLINAIIVHYFYGAFYLGTIDPEYFHLFNGIAISGGNLAVDYVAHPGTPLQFIIALSARFIHLFQPDEKLVVDFINDPEKYIHAANIFMNVLVAGTIYVSGVLTKHYSGSTSIGLLLQLSPFSNTSTLLISGRLLPESIMIIPLLLISILIIKHIFDSNKSNQTISTTVLYGLIIGFGIACKLSFIPMILLPLILLKITLKHKFQLLLYSGLFVVLFAYPIIINIHEFWDWVSGMLMHSGKWGGGDKSFIDTSSLPTNFSILYSYDKLFFIFMLASSLVSLVFTPIAAKTKNAKMKRIIRAIFAVNITLLVCVSFVLKHFALHYFMPFYAFKFLLLILIALLFLELKPFANHKKIKPTVLFLLSISVLYISYTETQRTSSTLQDLKTKQENYLTSQETILSLVKKDTPIIITGPYYGTPFIEYAQINGFMMSYSLKGYFKPYLMEKYPVSFLYVSWAEKFDFWDEFVGMDFIAKKVKSSFYVYIGKEKSEDLSAIETRIWSYYTKESLEKNILFEDTTTGEKLIEYTIAQEE